MARIALIAPTPLPSRRANTIQVMKMAQAINASGHEIQVFAPRAAGESWSEPGWETLAQHYGLSNKFSIRWLAANPRLKSYDFGLKAVRQARSWNAEIIFTRHPQAAAIASKMGIATVLEAHDFPQGVAGPLLLRTFLSGKGARRLISISKALLSDLETHFDIPKRIDRLIAPDGVDMERYTGLPDAQSARKALGLPERFTAGYTGHLYPGRGVDHILNIAARLPKITFLLAGGNPGDVAKYQKIAADLENVFFTGFVPNVDLPQYQAACDALLMPYQYKIEASSGGNIAAYLSPMKLFEYLASGKAILSSDLPVLREILNEKNAILLAPDDVSAWADALERLQNSPDLCAKFGQAAIQEAVPHTWQARTQRIFESLR